MGKFKLLEMDPEFEKDEEEGAKRGRPPFEPTDEQRELVKQMAIAGIDHGSMAIMIRWPDSDKPISKRTLFAKFPDELVQGVVQTNIRVAGSLYKMVLAGNVAATIFWLKVRAGWRETVHVEATGKDGAPLQGGITGVLVVPGVMNADEWQNIVTAQQGELMERAAKYVNSGVLDSEDAVIRSGT